MFLNFITNISFARTHMGNILTTTLVEHTGLVIKKLHGLGEFREFFYLKVGL